jgi:hypothetical protein
MLLVCALYVFHNIQIHGCWFYLQMLSNNILFVGMKQSSQILCRLKGPSNSGWWISFYVSGCNVFLWSLCRLIFSSSGPCGCGQALTATDFLKVKDIQEHKTHNKSLVISGHGSLTWEVTCDDFMIHCSP